VNNKLCCIFAFSLSCPPGLILWCAHLLPSFQNCPLLFLTLTVASTFVSYPLVSTWINPTVEILCSKFLRGAVFSHLRCNLLTIEIILNKMDSHCK
jgi:hypothetical protein